MQFLERSDDGRGESQLVLMFGLGMIGTAIRNALVTLGYEPLADIHYDWSHAQRRQAASRQIEQTCRSVGPISRISVIWSAGSAYFHSTREETEAELSVFKATIEWLQVLRQALQPERFEFHLVSSAGGLFEGQRLIEMDSKPTPLRPYGQLKLDQENHVLSRFSHNEIAFYRPSSVYGPMVQNARKGLINNLVNNGQNFRTTVLDAHVMALRDYVFSADIGHYVARLVRSGELSRQERHERFLVSARCASIFEVVKRVQRMLNLSLQVRYDEFFGNNSHITFSDQVLPRGWKPVTLDVGLRQFLVQPQVH